MDDFDMDEENIASPQDELAAADEALRKELSRPLTQDDCPKMTQLEIDVVNVFEKRVDISEFSQDRQKKIKDFYRFSPVNIESLQTKASGGGRSFWK